jgi:hypothetical protein
MVARSKITLPITALLLMWVSMARADESNSLRVDTPENQTLVGRDARLQLLVSHADTDVTHQVHYRTEPTGIVSVSSTGFVTPIADGVARVSAEHDSGLSASISINVSNTGHEPPLSFPGRIVPIFTKLGCNGGGCHGKAAGQNGFKLSLLGFEPREDFEHLVHESRGRRLHPALPDQSLMLTKAINASPHGGGQRMAPDSYEYRMLRRWIAQGMPYGSSSEPVVTSIEVLPRQRRLAAQATQQLAVLARYSDGSSEDVTRAAVFESNDPQMADVSPTGMVVLNDLIGDVAVMARYQGQVTVFRAIIPMDSQSGELALQPRNQVDKFVFNKLQSLGVPASPICDDATFLRRVTLDIAGRLPTLDEIERFESEPADTRRDRAIDGLLDSPEYAEFFALKWNTILRNRVAEGATAFANFAFHAWIRDSLDANMPYDEFVRQIVTASGSVASHPPVAWYTQVTSTTQRMEDAAQLFLGQRLQCANCHHHPYEKWSQQDYAHMAAFFVTIDKKSGSDPGEPNYITRLAAASYAHPKTGQPIAPAGLDDDVISPDPGSDVRHAFADWMTQPDNPFFARALVNRYWKHFLGRGLVEPEDDLRVTNPPTNPELLDALAQAFVDSGYDMKQLIRMITQSHTYQFDSGVAGDNLADRRNYSRFYPKRLSAEVLLDAIDHVTTATTSFEPLPVGTRAVALPDAAYGSYFMKVFGRSNATTACECESTQEPNLAQNLLLLNSAEIQAKLAADTGRAAQLAAAEANSDGDQIRQLYRIALSRHPADDELQAALNYLAGKPNRRQAYEDIIWSLINAKEFLFNH